MSRKPQTNDEKVDAMIKDFMETEGRLPTIAEIRQILPYGIGNDRASQARRRAEAKIKHGVGASPGAPRDESGDVCQEDKASSRSIPTTTELVRGLLDNVDAEYASREGLLRDALNARIRAELHEMLDEFLDQLFGRFR